MTVDQHAATSAAVTPEPSPSEYRARCLLALALLNHRQSSAGLSLEDAEQVRLALLGKWDGVAA